MLCILSNSKKIRRENQGVLAENTLEMSGHNDHFQKTKL